VGTTSRGECEEGEAGAWKGLAGHYSPHKFHEQGYANCSRTRFQEGICCHRSNCCSGSPASTSECSRYVATLTWPSVGVKPNTWKGWDLESSGTPECLELDNKGQNTSHWGVLGVIGKVLKRKYRKWPRIGNSDICSPSYGHKKGRESSWQFDSRPLKVENRCLSDIRIGSAIRRWKDRDESYNFGLDLVAIQLCSRELWRFKVPGVPSGQNRDSISGVPGICAIWMPPPWRAAENTIGSKVVAYSRAKDVVSPSESGSPWLVPTPKECKWNLTNSCWFVMQVRVI
jgi:hypothetical protein